MEESLLVMRDKSFLNRNIRSTPLYLFDKVKVYSPFGELNSWILIILIVASFTFIGKCLNKLKLDIHICSSQDITIVLLVMTLALISFLCFFSLSMWLLVFHLEYQCIVLWLIRVTSYLRIGWSLRPKRRKNTWFSRKITISCRGGSRISLLCKWRSRISFLWNVSRLKNV